MPSHTTSVQVPVSAEVVVTRLGTMDGVERWHPLYRDLRVDEGGTAAVVDFYGRRLDLGVTLERHPDRVEVHGTGRRLTMVDRLVVEPTSDGCRIDYELSMQTRGALRPLSKGLAPLVERAVARGARRLTRMFDPARSV